MKMRKVLGMGNALVDVLAVIEDDSILTSLQLPKGSMQLIDEISKSILDNEIKDLNKTIVSGGSAANTIVGLANLRINTGFLGRIGKDTYGKHFKNDLEKNNIISHLTEVDEQSGVATTLISKDGQRTFGTYLGAAALLNADELIEKSFEGYNYFYIEGYLVQNYALIEKAIILAKKAGAKIILDLASYNVVEANRDFLLRIIAQYVDILFANEDESRSLLDLDAEKAVSVLAEIIEIAVVKTGETGSWAQKGKEKVFIPAHVVKCVDTTGAGDLYAAGFIYGLIHKCPISACGQIGTLLAAEVIKEIGAKIPNDNWPKLLIEIEDLITNSKKDEN